MANFRRFPAAAILCTAIGHAALILEAFCELADGEALTPETTHWPGAAAPTTEPCTSCDCGATIWHVAAFKDIQVESPCYPKEYPLPCSCTYHVYVPDGFLVVFHADSLQMPNNTDAIELVNKDGYAFQTCHTGTEKECPDYRSDGRHLAVKFRADPSPPGGGQGGLFVLSFEAVPNSTVKHTTNDSGAALYASLCLSVLMSALAVVSTICWCTARRRIRRLEHRHHLRSQRLGGLIRAETALAGASRDELVRHRFDNSSFPMPPSEILPPSYHTSDPTIVQPLQLSFPISGEEGEDFVDAPGPGMNPLDEDSDDEDDKEMTRVIQDD